MPWTTRTAAAACLAALLTLCIAAYAQPALEPGALAARALAAFGTLPSEASNVKNPVTEEKITLGRMLFYDARLSTAGDVSCNSCHLLTAFGVDHQPTSSGHEGQRGGRNAPSVYHAAFHIAQFWDGRAPDVEEQAKGPVLNPIEMAMTSEAEVVQVLRSIPGYEPLFRAAFPDDSDPITFDNMARAIAAFERRLVNPSRFDTFVAGTYDVLTPAELRGLQTVLDTGCVACHAQATIGGTLFQKLGVVHPYPTEDVGRFQVTGKESDRFVFKVPSLRNAMETGPYFHDGSIETLEEAVRRMGHHQLGKELSGEQVKGIVAFLSSLTGTIDEQYVARPELPPSPDGAPKAARR
jgi:cytochrome c peroxidase